MIVDSDEHGIVIRIVNVVVRSFLPRAGHPLFEFFIKMSIILTVVSLVDEDAANTDGVFPTCRDTEPLHKLFEGLVLAIDLLSPPVDTLFCNMEERFCASF